MNARNALGAMLGLAEDRDIKQRALLVRPLPQNDERQDYLRATLSADPDGTLRAVFGDLSVRTITADRLPEREAIAVRAIRAAVP